MKSQRLSAITRRITGYFIKGLLLTVPLGITIYMVVASFMFLDGLLPFEWPGVSILLVLTGTTLLGFFGTILIQTPILHFFNRSLEKVPLIKFIYTSVRDMLSAFVGKEKRFNKPVMVKMSRESGIYKLGFITRNDMHELGVPSGRSAVYFPHSYNFSGNLFLVDNDLITPLNAQADEVMKFIVSGGVSRI
jgi:uncharacterized membrane protein